MNARQHHRTLTRREALGRICMAAGAAGAARIARAQPAASPGAGRLVERLPNGVEVWQVTTEDFPQSNIYGEVPYCSADSRWLVYARTNRKLPTNRTEFMVVELGTWKQHRLDTAASLSGCAISPGGVFYYVKRADDGELDLLRADLAQGRPERVYRFRNRLQIRSLGTVTSDGRYYAGGVVTDPEWKMFGVALVDLTKGEQAIIDRDPFILNPHPQFEPRDGRQLLIQHNRGGAFSPDGKLERLVGPEGATLYLLSVPEGKRTTLRVGTPFTTPCTGHEAWIGPTQEVLLSVAASGNFAPDQGNLLAIRAGGDPRVVARAYRFNHIGASRCGKLFSADDWQGAYKLVIGSTAGGKWAEVCESKTKPTRDQSSHPHPYLPPDLKWLIFNSTRSGPAHLYAARLPEALVAGLV